jgi:hypothetical protein
MCKILQQEGQKVATFSNGFFSLANEPFGDKRAQLDTDRKIASLAI